MWFISMLRAMLEPATSTGIIAIKVKAVPHSIRHRKNRGPLECFCSVRDHESCDGVVECL